MRFTNRAGLPKSLVDVITADDFDPRRVTENVYWLTKILMPPKVVELERRHYDEIEVDVTDKVSRIIGTALHDWISRRLDKTNRLSEEKAYIDLSTFDVHTCRPKETIKQQDWYDKDTMYVSCKLDCYDPDEEIVEDYKTTKSWTVVIDGGMKPDWIQQLNVYAYVLRKLGFPVKGARAVLWITDWQKSKANEERYPKAPIHISPATLLPDEEIEVFLKERVRAHVQALNVEKDDQIPECSPEERWSRPTTYAVMRTGRKTAVRVFDEMGMAEAKKAELGKDHYVEERPGCNTRCEGYCTVADFCHFGKDQPRS